MIIEKKNDIRDKQVKNELYKLYSQIDPDILIQSIDSLVDRKIQEYMLINIDTRESRYMNAQDTDDMIKNVSASLYLNLSDMYITFIKMIHSISSDEDLIVFINNEVKMRSIPIVLENNKLVWTS